ncbi:MAG: phosphoserine phosphatase SerB, partial [Proteobacteria bacterium]|nr:phosphoserine phosphatase SerB [Pseudomonadota bacterium]
EAREILEHLLANVPFDAVVQKAAGRKKKLLISDMDSTIINQECIDELADFAGLKAKVSAITERAMNGELDFKEALRERVGLLSGMDESVLQKVYDERITFMAGAKTLVKTMKQNGAQCILVSGGFTFFTSRVKDAVGFDLDEANILLIENAKLTGKVKEPILDKQSKRDALSFYTEKFDLKSHETMAVGDGANDLPMLQLAGLGVAYHAKPNVRAQARARIDTCDLTALLYVQGYTKEQVCFI